MLFFIDTNSEWNGGYLSHLRGFLSSEAVGKSNNEYFVYGTTKLKTLLEPLHKNVIYIVDDNLPKSFYKMNAWRKNKLPSILKKYSPNVHFNTMGWLASQHNICPTITMCRNLQPFIVSEVKKVSLFSKERYRLILAKQTMIQSYNNANGIIFLSEFAKEIILPLLKSNMQNIIIPHGVNEYFRKNENEINTNIQIGKPINLLYVSKAYNYKNHDKVIIAVNLLRKKLNADIQLTLIGGISLSAYSIIRKTLKQLTDTEWIHWIEDVPNQQLIHYYHTADIFVFASSVENFPNILLEAMASGLPIACSNHRPMIDILQGSGELFNPENPESIAFAIENLIQDSYSRNQKAKKSYKIAKNYSYERMSTETINFLQNFK